MPEQLDLLGPLPRSRPREIARRWLSVQQPVVSWRGAYFSYTDGAYRPLNAREYRELLDLWLETQEELVMRNKHPTPIQYRVSSDNSKEILDAVAGITLVPEEVEFPCWRDHKPTEKPLCLEDGLLYLSCKELLPHTPTYITTNKLPIAWKDGSAEGCPRWLDFLAVDWSPAQVAYFQEWCGYLIAPHRKYQKFLLIQGPRRSGKGTILDVLVGLVGQANSYPCKLQTFSTKFLDDKFPVSQMIYVSDGRSAGGKSESGSALEFLLSYTGNDAIGFERKYRPIWQGKPIGKLVVCSNLPLPFQDASNALSSRVCLFERYRSFAGQEDTELGDKLAKELRGIFFWALEGLERLDKRGKFDQSSEPKLLADTFAHTSNPVKQFLAEETREGHSVMVRHIYDRWVEWCRSTGTHNNLRQIQFLTAVLQCGGWVTAGEGREMEVLGIEMKGVME